MPSIVRSFRLMIVAVVLLAGARWGHAEPPIPRPKSQAALAHLAEGNKLYDVRDFKKAADEYKAGALIEESPIFDYNLGQCYRQAGDYKAAIWHYQRFLHADSAPGARTEAVKRFIVQMQAELDRQAMTEPPTEPAPEVQQPATAPPAPSSAPAPGPISVTARAPVDRWYQDWFGWGLSGVGFVGATVGGALLIDGASLNSQANHTPNQQEANALHDQADTRTLLGGVIGGVGVGLLVTGIIKLAIHPSAADTSTSAAWYIGVSANRVFVVGSF